MMDLHDGVLMELLLFSGIHPYKSHQRLSLGGQAKADLDVRQ